jgi:hypothetical protein
VRVNRDLAVIVWDEKTHWLDLTYFEGEPDSLIASESVAAILAADAGLTAVPGADGTRRWVRRAEAKVG